MCAQYCGDLVAKMCAIFCQHIYSYPTRDNCIVNKFVHGICTRDIFFLKCPCSFRMPIRRIHYYLIFVCCLGERSQKITFDKFQRTCWQKKLKVAFLPFPGTVSYTTVTIANSFIFVSCAIVPYTRHCLVRRAKGVQCET